MSYHTADGCDALHWIKCAGVVTECAAKCIEDYKSDECISCLGSSYSECVNCISIIERVKLGKLSSHMHIIL